MDFFPVVALIIATFLLLIGIVGRGASMGSSQFHITLEGSIGRLPRVAILTASILTYILAIFLFVYAEDSKSSSGSAPSAAPSVLVLAPNGDVPNSTIEISIAGRLTASDSGVEITEERATISISDSDPLTLYLDSDQNEQNGIFDLDPTLSDTDVDYSVNVVCEYEDGSKEEYAGSGVITVEDGGKYEITLYEDFTATIE